MSARSMWEPLFPAGHVLAGFDPEGIGLKDYNGERGQALRTRLHERYADYNGPGVIGLLPDGRWGIAAMTPRGCYFAEEPPAEPPASAKPVLGKRKVYNGVHFIPLTPDECHQFLNIGLRHMSWDEIVRRAQEIAEGRRR